MSAWKRKEVIGNATPYLGDCLEILPHLPKVDAVITDPPWDAAVGIPGADDPRGLFASAAPLLAGAAARVVVQLGCDSDPVFLAPLARFLPFLRTCWLEYACPLYKGRLLHTGDVAYAYGIWPEAKPGAMLIPGKCMSTHSDRDIAHPMPRRLEHVRWLVNWFSVPGSTVVDPFMGSGTTGVCAHDLGREFVGIEIHEPYFDFACERIENAQRQQRIFA